MTQSAPKVIMDESLAAATAVEETGVEDSKVAPPDPAASDPGFGGLSHAFLGDMQSALESLGYDLTSESAMEQLSKDSSLGEKVLPALMGAGGGGKDAATLLELVRRWQEALERQVEADREAKRKKQVPVWRCAVCGRYGCPVAPDIESFWEMED